MPYMNPTNITLPDGTTTTVYERPVSDFITDEDEKEWRKTRLIYDRDKEWVTLYNNFYRFGVLDPFTSNTHTKEYIFITKPDLNIDSAAGSSSVIADGMMRYPYVAQQLKNAGMPFSQLLFNGVNGHLDLPGISADTIDSPANVNGTKITYRGTSSKSDEDFDFSLDFKDTKYLDIYMWFKMYDEYEKLKWLGIVSPPMKYIVNRILHDQVSIYKIIVADDGMTIRYWARITGCMPLSVPRETFSELSDGEITFSTQWKGHFVQDMDPQILIDFNRLVGAHSGDPLPIFNVDKLEIETTLPTSPYIRMDGGNSNTRGGAVSKYELVWY